MLAFPYSHVRQASQVLSTEFDKMGHGKMEHGKLDHGEKSAMVKWITGNMDHCKIGHVNCVSVGMF